MSLAETIPRPPRRKGAWRRALLFTPLWIVVMAAVSGHVVYAKLHHSLPQTQGVITLKGLSAPVDMLRDKWGVPHIYAASREDAAFAQGFAHAQDRLWQMEFARRAGRGRLSEILGKPALTIDRLMRAGDLAGLAQRIHAALPQPARGVLEAYAAGVNAYLATRKGPLPLQFMLTETSPEPWRAEDSIILIKLMAAQLSGNAMEELIHAELLRALTPEKFASLYPQFPALPRLQALYETELPKRASAPATPIKGASNNWAVDGRWTKSGKPLLANDPHLGLAIPSIWYLAHLSVGGHNVIGASLAGVPGIVLGRNDRLAWAYTNTGADVEDLVLEKIAAETPEHYVSPGGARPFTLRTETIKVRGGDAVTETFRTSAHGPIIPSDLPGVRDIVPEGYRLAINWDVLKDGDLTMLAGLELQEAETGESFERALAPYVAPMQNMVFADADGRIGFIAPGHVPLRGPTNDTHGLIPAPGWKPGYDWSGLIPFAELPRNLSPAEGYIVTANNKIVGDSYPYTLGYDFDRDARARRITERLTRRHDHDVASFVALQRDAVSLEAQALLPKLLSALDRGKPGHPLAGEARAQLAGWDGAMTSGRPEPLIFAAFMRETVHAVLTSLVGAENLPLTLAWRFDLVARTLDQADGPSLAAQAFDRALAGLVAQEGGRPALWRWGHPHKAVMQSEPFGQIPLLGPLLNREVPSDGGADTINRGLSEFTSARPFANVHGSTYRAVYDLGTPENSVFMISSGQSGNPLSRHYDDLIALWAQGETIPMTTARETIAQEAGSELLRLEPEAGR